MQCRVFIIIESGVFIVARLLGVTFFIVMLNGEFRVSYCRTKCRLLLSR